MIAPRTSSGPGYVIRRLDSQTGEPFARFLSRLRSDHWSLTSSAHLRKPKRVESPDPEQLLEAERAAGRIGTYLLEKDSRILGSLCLDYSADRSAVVFSNAEADPSIQRRGVFAICLARPCFLSAMDLDVSTFAMTTWAFNRKAFPLYAKAGFRAVPETSVTFVSFFPVLFRCLSHEFRGSTRRFLDEHTPQKTRSGISGSGVPCTVYPYAWRSGLQCDVQVEKDSGATHLVRLSHGISSSITREVVQ